MSPTDEAFAEFELLQELERFTTRFTDRIAQAMTNLQSSARPGVRDEGAKKALVYVSSAMEIATGAYPRVNLLDMVVFIRLSRTVLEKHWIPRIYGEEGGELSEAFAKSEHELSDIAERALPAAHRQQLAELVDAWLAHNPTQTQVAGVRLADFSTAAGHAAVASSGSARGLLSSVKSASLAANHALLLSERALFLVHRLPFVWRLQARVGAREVLGDVLASMYDGPHAPIAAATKQIQLLMRRLRVYGGVLGVGAAALWLFRRGPFARRR
jgi:hypothetical protein